MAFRKAPCLLAVLLLTVYALADERILDLRADIAVQQDASLLVHETIRVRSTGDQIRHGIYRDFPTRYRDRVGNAYTVQFDLRSARRDRQPVDFPKGLVSKPSSAQRVFWFLQDNASALMGLAGLFAVAIYYWVAWMRVGRDPKRGTIVVRYEPPKNLSPAAIRFLKHRSYDDRSFASAIVSLAVQRHLSVQETGSAYTLKRIDAQNDHLPPEEMNLLHNLFVSGDVLAINAACAKVIGNASITLKNDLGKAEAGLFRRNGTLMIPGIVLSLITFVAMLPGNPDVQNNRSGAAIVAILASALPFGMVASFRQAWRARKARAGSGGSLIGVSVPFLFEVGLLALFIWLTNVTAALILAALLAANIVFYWFRTALTSAGRALLDEVDGFQDFLVSVEGDRLQRLSPPDKTPALFEKYLPYALALGVEQRWTQQFRGVLAQAATAAGGTTAGYAPDWYMGSCPGLFEPERFASTLSSGFSSALSAASSPPGSSSGSDSSGSSGGGGGGGW